MYVNITVMVLAPVHRVVCKGWGRERSRRWPSPSPASVSSAVIITPLSDPLYPCQSHSGGSRVQGSWITLQYKHKIKANRTRFSPSPPPARSHITPWVQAPLTKNSNVPMWGRGVSNLNREARVKSWGGGTPFEVEQAGLVGWRLVLAEGDRGLWVRAIPNVKSRRPKP